ncbi:5-hydroxytryptamine receptor 1F-like [Haliotis cracherodii]|uniref:5-hydroxytryptamine receptor 1F-like n=1 Tax=Haliotis cracherodii TaxID=6455 RepID=UPI0039EBB546
MYPSRTWVVSDMASTLGSPTVDYNDSTSTSSVDNITTTTVETLTKESSYEVWLQVVISLILSCMIVGTVIGNSLVCIAVGIVKRLQTPSNLLIVSLATADLLVAILVMPLSLYKEIRTKWRLGESVCDMWTSLDVLLCTASILNLCMISVDRYFVITRPLQYAMKRTPKRMGIMIAVVWVASALISIPPIFGWKALRGPYECYISNELGYQIYATLGAFYLPLTVMIVVYYKIWRVSSRIAKAEQRSQIGNIDRPPEFQVGRPSRDSGDSHILPNGSIKDSNLLSSEDDTTKENLLKKNSIKRRRFTIKSIIPSKQRMSTSKERKATKTLGIIMGCFTACWLPFFILAVVQAVCVKVYGPQFDKIPGWIVSVLMWLGYANSFLNPVIYARFNREFRTPFKEILCCRCRGINVRMRSESYVEQYGADHAVKDSLRPPAETMVRYNSHGQTLVQIGNGSPNSQGESKI